MLWIGVLKGVDALRGTVDQMDIEGKWLMTMFVEGGP